MPCTITSLWKWARLSDTYNEHNKSKIMKCHFQVEGIKTLWFCSWHAFIHSFLDYSPGERQLPSHEMVFWERNVQVARIQNLWNHIGDLGNWFLLLPVKPSDETTVRANSLNATLWKTLMQRHPVICAHIANPQKLWYSRCLLLSISFGWFVM